LLALRFFLPAILLVVLGVAIGQVAGWCLAVGRYIGFTNGVTTN
jgi:hypothetical protein